jgi:hypothetical protein
MMSLDLSLVVTAFYSRTTAFALLEQRKDESKESIQYYACNC